MIFPWRIIETIKMDDLTGVNKARVEDVLPEAQIEGLREMMASSPHYTINPRVSVYGAYVDRLVDEFTYVDQSGRKILWSKLHGKKRKVAKYYIRQNIKRLRRQIALYNKYIGTHTLCIHCIHGTKAWTDEKWTNHISDEWVLDACDDWYDRSECYIYATPEKWGTYIDE